MPIQNWAIVLNQFITILRAGCCCNYENSIVIYTKFWTVPFKAKQESFIVVIQKPVNAFDKFVTSFLILFVDKGYIRHTLKLIMKCFALINKNRIK